jgi:hypothetical protein
MCTLDEVPAATLLLPYFEVDLGADPGAGVNTVFTINNALPNPALARVILWSDWSQPVLGFDIFLTGYDAQTVDLYEILAQGVFPVTADEQSDQGQADGRATDPTSSCDGTVDSCSPHGTHPEWDGSFPQTAAMASLSCLDIFPFFVNPLLQGSLLEMFQDKLLGQPVEGLCYGTDHGDSIARGYVTIDNVEACSLIFPFEAGYFTDGVDPGIASHVNQLWGDWSFLDPNNALTLAVDPLVHIEASDSFDGSSTATGATFYGRYTQATGGLDGREPLPNVWGFSYQDLGPGRVTDLVVWRDSTANNQNFEDGFPCGSGPGTGPDWNPLGQERVVCFDQAEEMVELCTDASCFPLESQRLEFGGGELDVPWSAGWCYLETNIADDGITGDVDFPSSGGTVAQSWVGATLRSAGIVSGGYSSVALGSSCEQRGLAIWESLFTDGFESGNTMGWSATQE